MAEALPLFPLSTVLFPGMPLPLHIFEDRYRLLMRELLEGPVPRRFGVVAIRQGREVADETVPVLYEVGCVAELRDVEHYADGRMDIVTTGGPRFRLRETDDSRPYLMGAVDYLPDTSGDGAAARGEAVRVALADYVEVAAAVRGERLVVPELPPESGEDLQLLSYVVASTLQLDLPEKQALLETTDISTRLRAELTLLRRETALLRHWLDDAPEVPTIGPFSLS